MTAEFFPIEMVQTMPLTADPWFPAGMAAYLGGTLVMLKPDLKLNTCHLILSAGVAGPILIHTVSQLS